MSTASAFNLITARVQVLEFSLDPILTAVLLVQWIYWGSSDWTWLEHPVARLTARLSYSLYLFQGLVLILVPDPLRIVPIPHSGRITELSLFVLLAAAFYYGVESPFLRMRDRVGAPSVLLDDGIPYPK